MPFDPDKPFDIIENSNTGFDPNKPFEIVEDIPRQTWGGVIKDTAIDAAKGVVGGGRAIVGLTNIFTGNLAGKGLSKVGYDPEATNEILSSGYSDRRKYTNQKVSEAEGFWPTIVALVDHPSVAFGAIVESAPMTLTGVAAARTAAVKMLGSALAKNNIAAGTEAAKAFAGKFFADKTVQGTLVAVGAGTEGAQTAGGIQEQGRHAGRSYGETIGPALAAGLTTTAIGAVTSKIPGLRDAEASIATAGLGAQRSGSGILGSAKEVGKAMVKEGPIEENLQSGQEQYFTNVAMGEDDTAKGVTKAMATGTVVGAMQGGGMSLGSELLKAPIDKTKQSNLGTIAANVVVEDQEQATDEVIAETGGMEDVIADNVTIIDPATGEFTTSTGKPFVSESALRTHARLKHVDLDNYSITRRDNGFVAVPFAKEDIIEGGTDNAFDSIDITTEQKSATDPAKEIQQQPDLEDVKRLGPHLREMWGSIEQGTNPDFVKPKVLNDWEKQTGEPVKSYVSSTSAKETLLAVGNGEQLTEEQAKVWSYLKSVAENKAMVAEQGTGEFSADFGGEAPAPANNTEGESDKGWSAVNKKFTDSPSKETAQETGSWLLSNAEEGDTLNFPEGDGYKVTRVTVSKTTGRKSVELIPFDENGEENVPAMIIFNEDDPGSGVVGKIPDNTHLLHEYTYTSASSGERVTQRSRYEKNISAPAPAKPSQRTMVDPETGETFDIDTGEIVAPVEPEGEPVQPVTPDVSPEDRDLLDTNDIMNDFADSSQDGQLRENEKYRQAKFERMQKDTEPQGAINDSVQETGNQITPETDTPANLEGKEGTVPEGTQGDSGAEAGPERKGLVDDSGEVGGKELPVKVRDTRGDTYYVMQSDIDNGNRTILPIYKKDGSKSNLKVPALHRDNIKTDDEIKANYDTYIWPLDGQDGKGYTSEASTIREINKIGQKVSDYDIVEDNGRFVANRTKAWLDAHKQPDPVTANEEGVAEGNGSDSDRVNNPSSLVEHTVKKSGKIIKGIVRTDLTKEEAKKIDPYTFKKDGGFFIREKYLTDAEKNPVVSQETTTSPVVAQETDNVSDKGGDQISPVEPTGETVQGKSNAQVGDTVRGEAGIDMEVISSYANQDDAMKSEVLLNKDTGKFHSVLTDVDSGSVVGVKIFNDKKLADEDARAKANLTPTEEPAAEKPKIKNNYWQNDSDTGWDGKPLPAEDEAVVGSQSSKTTEQKQPVNAKEEAVVGSESSKDQFANNKLFTADAVEAARARLKAKRNSLNAGLDPELIQDMLTLGGAYFEAGIRDFATWSKTVLSDIGDEFKPFLRGTYENLRYYPGLDTEGITSHADVDAILSDEKKLLSPEKEPTIKETQSTTTDGVNNGTLAARNEKGTAEDDRDGTKGDVTESVSPDKRGGEGTTGISGTEGSGLNGGIRDGKLPDGTAGQENGPVANEAGPGNRDADKDDLGSSPGGQPNIPGKPLHAGRDYRIPAGGIKREGSWKATAKRNLDIIELAKKLDKENRPATPEEQELLSLYTGFGASEIANNLFPGYAQNGKVMPNWARDEGWKELATRLTDILTKDEIKTAARSTQYAHYTSEAVINSIYSALQKFGFKGGKVLEPGAGVSSFWGLIPKSMHNNSNYTGIEMDHVTALIAKHLYPQQNILRADFTQQKLPGNFFDLAIGNPPFSDTKITSDPDYKRNKFMLHDYFFAKSVDKVRPGGLLVFVTSKGTMDKGNDSARQYLADRADLLGAIRLPQTAFKQNAGTEVVTDVLFFKKREEGQLAGGEAWLDLGEVTTPEGPTLINEYFVAHPEMILGTNSLQGTRYRANEYTVLPLEGNIEDHFAKAIENLPSSVYSKAKEKAKPKKTKKTGKKAEKREDVVEYEFDLKNKKEGGLYLNDKGKLMRVKSGAGMTVTSLDGLTEKQITWLKDYVPLRDAVKKAQHDQLTNGDWEKSLKALNKAYDKFVAKNGPIHDNTITEKIVIDEDGEKQVNITKRYKNKKVMFFDADSPAVRALEKEDDNGNVTKGPFLTGRSIQKPERKKPETIADALALSLDFHGVLDLADIADSIGITEQEAIDGLGDLIYKNPEGAAWETRDGYLAGDVKGKLAIAKAAAAADSQYERNVKALTEVQPAPLKAADVTVKLGVPWIDTNIIQQFASEVFGVGVSIEYSPSTNYYKVSPTGNNTVQGGRGEASEWATQRRSSIELLDSVLNNRTIKVVDTIDKKTVPDVTGTVAANEIADKMRKRFSSWVWEDAGRAGNILDEYNEKYNNLSGRKFDGSHLTLPGVSLRFNLHPHQKNAIWRIIQTGNTYLGHAVGAGKTMIMIAAGMEMKRLGLVHKPIYVVPKHMLAQFSNEFLELYPMANIMVADEENFHTDNRRSFIAQAALNSPDAIIITHPSLAKLGMRQENIDVVGDEMIQDLRDSLAEMEADDSQGNRFLIKRVESRIEKLEQMLAGMVSQDRDQSMTFEEIGADFMFVDEAHEFRKLDFATNRQAKGIDSKGSMKAIDLFIKTKWLGTQSPGRSHAFASGTPVTNTMGELYNLMRFFIDDQMEAEGIRHFDAWASMFGEVAPDFERNAAGKPVIVERFAKFVNVPELMKRVRSFMDVLTFTDLGAFVKRPDVSGGVPKMVISKQSKELTAYLKGELSNRIEESLAFKPSKQQPGNPDPMINIITDGRLASIDMRYINPRLPNDPGSKLNTMIDGIIETWKNTGELAYDEKIGGGPSKMKGAAQIVFFNLGFGDGVKQRGFDARSWMTKRLKEAGIPASEIGWMEDANTAAKKDKLFTAVRSGEKKIIIGSAKQMGTGVNVQNRLHTLHYMDAPWFPADVEQPLGRIIRQGNQNEMIDIFWYATEGSYDSTMWQMVARKSKFIEQAFSGDDSVRSIEDVSASSTYEMATAIASGDSRVIQLAGLRNEIERLERLKTAHADNQRTMASNRRMAENSLAWHVRQAKYLTEAAAKVGGFIREPDGIVDGKSFEKRAELGQAIQEKVQARVEEVGEIKDSAVAKDVGKLNGYPLVALIGRRGANLQLVITKNVKLEVNHEGDAAGLVTRLMNTLNGVATKKRDNEGKIEDYKDEIAKYDKKLGAPYEHGAELNQKIAEAQQLQNELTSEDDAPPIPSDGILISMDEGLSLEEAGLRKGHAVSNKGVSPNRVHWAKEATDDDQGQAAPKQSQSSQKVKNPSSLADLSRDQRAVIQPMIDSGDMVMLSAAEAEAILVEAGVSAEQAKFMVAWHGSPHDHDGFRMDKVGTGEGAQIYGHGLYFAGSKEVAEWYRKKLGKNLVAYLNGKKIADQAGYLATHIRNIMSAFDFKQGKEDAIADLKFRLAVEEKSVGSGWLKDATTQDIKKAIATIEEANEGDIDARKGTLYQVELAPEQEDYLDWDKPLSEQSEVVKEAIQNAFNDIVNNESDYHKASKLSRELTVENFKEKDGNDIYRTISREHGSDKAASEYLHSLGIRGIRYLDGSSRGKGEGDSNFVIFDESDVSITAKYSADGKVQGFAMPDGKVYLIPENIEQGKLWGVIKHEVGVHVGQVLHNNKEFQNLLRSLEKRQFEQTPTGEALREAFKRVPKNTKKEHVSEEVLAYMVENHPEVTLVRRVIALIKRILFKMGVDAKIFTAADFAALADMAVRVNSMKGGAVSTGKAKLPKSNDGTRFSVSKETPTSPLSTESLAETAGQMGTLTVLKNKKVDSTFLDRILSTPEYYFKKFAAAGRVLQAALLRRDIRYEKEQAVLGDFVTYIKELREKFKDAYKEANDYLLNTDQTGDGFRIKTLDSGKYQVSKPESALTEEEIQEIEDSIDRTQSPDKQAHDRWKAIEEKRIVGEFVEEEDGVKAMLDAESALLKERGYSEEAIVAIRKGRELTNRGFDIMAADMRRIIQEAKDNGLPNPFIGDGKIDESGRYGVYAAGKSKPIALFATQKEANEMLDNAAQMISYVVTSRKKGRRTFTNELKAKRWAKAHSGTVKGNKAFQNLTVKKRSDKDMRPLTVKAALAQMGDLRGTFFPRIRESGEYVLIARKDGENPIRKHFDIPAVGDDKPTLQAFLSKTTPIGREIKALRLRGYNVTTEKDKSPSEDVFEATNLITSLDALLQSSMEVVNKNEDMSVKAGQHINKILTMQIADIFKSRGYLSSRLKRLAGDEVWEGYEEDMGKALTQYGKSVAAGTAKRDTARAMVLAFSGRDYTWEQYKTDVEKPEWAEYQRIVEERRIDERTQKNLFRDVRSFMIDILRNDEQVDRIIGTLKGLAVLKYLGFRVSSAAVNLTNMAQGVPATISGHTGESLTKAIGRVISAATAYGKYRLGKDISDDDRKIFEYISAKGWDEAQFNHEAASELRGKLGEGWNKFMTAGMYMFGAAEKVNRATTLFAAYKAVDAKETTAEESVKWEKAKEISDRAHGVYGKETIPAWARGKYNILRLTYLFQKFSHNYMLNMIDLGFNRKEYKAAAYMLLSPALLAGSSASLAGPVLFALAGAFGIGGDDPEEAWYKWAEDTFGAGDYARHGVFGGLVGVNIKGSLQMNNPMPTSLTELVGAAGGVVADTGKGINHLFHGELAKGAEMLLPTAFGSWSKSIREGREGITTSNYGSVFYGDEPLKADAADQIIRFLSFNPSRISGIREKQWNEKEVAAGYQGDRAEIYSSIKRRHLQGKSITPEIYKAIYKYNERVKRSGRKDISLITPKNIRIMMKRNSKPNRTERYRDI